MIHHLLSITANAEIPDQYNWLIAAAALSPVLLYWVSKKKIGRPQKLFIKQHKLNWLQRWYLKRIERRMKKGDDADVGKLFGVLLVLFFLGGAIIAFIKGNAATGIVALLLGVLFLAVLLAVLKK
jgi:hypothetical protein